MNNLNIGIVIAVVGSIAVLIIVCINLLRKNRSLEGIIRDKEHEISQWQEEKLGNMERMIALEQEVNLIKGENDEMHVQQREFLRELLHELRIPMSVAKGFADILVDGLITDEVQQKQYLIKIGEKIEYINELISSFFANSKLVQEELGISAEGEQFGYYDLIEKITDIINEFKLVACNKGIDIHLSTVEKTVYLYCDIIKITQAISNLISNSIKYMEKPGDIQISLAYSGRDDLTVIVRDNGNGISKELVQNMFEKGVRFHENHSESQGLGLAICKENIEMHGGKIWCKSEEGKGMTTYIVLPCKLLETQRNERIQVV